MPKRIRFPALLIMERVWKLQFNLGAHEGQVEFDPVTMTKWKYESEKGGWTYQGSLKDVVRPTNTHAVILMRVKPAVTRQYCLKTLCSHHSTGLKKGSRYSSPRAIQPGTTRCCLMTAGL